MAVPRQIDRVIFGSCVAAAGAVLADRDGLPEVDRVVDYAEKLYDEIERRYAFLAQDLLPRPKEAESFRF